MEQKLSIEHIAIVTRMIVFMEVTKEGVTLPRLLRLPLLMRNQHFAHLSREEAVMAIEATLDMLIMERFVFKQEIEGSLPVYMRTR